MTAVTTDLPPWAERTHPSPPSPPAAAVVIPCAGVESGRVLLAGLRALASGNPALAALLAKARVEAAR